MTDLVITDENIEQYLDIGFFDADSTNLTLKNQNFANFSLNLINTAETITNFVCDNNNNLIEIPSLSTLTNLSAIRCTNNDNLQQLPDLSNLTSINSLTIVNNKSLTTILNLPVSLRFFDCRNNSSLITLPDLPNLPNLLSFDCRNNNLQQLPNGLSNLTNLVLIRCSNNHLTTLLPELIQFDRLSELDCAYNNLQTLPILPNSVRTLIISIDQIGILINNDNTGTDALMALHPDATITIKDILYFPTDIDYRSMNTSVSDKYDFFVNDNINSNRLKDYYTKLLFLRNPERIIDESDLIYFNKYIDAIKTSTIVRDQIIPSIGNETNK